MEIFHVGRPEHVFDISSKPVCQVEYLKRCDQWERGVLAVPYTLNGLGLRLPQIYSKHVYFDLETLYMPDDLGHTRFYANEHREEVIPKQRLGLAVTLNDKGKVECWDECGTKEMIDYLLDYDSLISFNGLRFDNIVLSRYATPHQISEIYHKSFDLYAYLEQLTGVRRSLEFFSNRLGVGGNAAKSLIRQGLGYEEGRLVKGFTSVKARRTSETIGNPIPLILRRGAAAQKRLVWIACFEDVLNTAAVVQELVMEQDNQKYRKQFESEDYNERDYEWLYK